MSKEVSMKRWMVSVSVVLSFLVSACATTPVPVGERANPAVQTLENASYRIAFEPKKMDGNFFRIFLLTVQNKGAGDIEIDWNRTRYLYEGKEAAGFVFQGITPADVSAGAIPSDVVPAGGTFFREIAPHRLIAFAPIRDKSVVPGESGISAGPLPGGKNGISLTLRKDGKEIRERLEISIEVLY
jgi:hypothetical protein